MIDSISKESELSTIKKVQDLTQKYASYSRTRSGLGNVLGGIVGLVVYFSGVLLGSGIVTAVIAILLTIAWLVGKELIRKNLYRQFGIAEEITPSLIRGLQLAVIAMLSLIVFAILILALSKNAFTNPQMWPYLLIIASMPWIAWHYFRNVSEFMMGVFLLCVCAVSTAGGSYNNANAIWLPFIAIFMIIIGIIEHRRFQMLKNQLNEKSQEC